MPAVASYPRPWAGQLPPPSCVVYSSRFLEQSFRHFRARYEAFCACDVVLEALAGDPSNKSRAHHRKRREKIVRVGNRLARASNLLPAFVGALVSLIARRLYRRSSASSEDRCGVFLCMCGSIVCVCACIISGCCRQLWRGCRLMLLPRRRAMKARSARSAVLHAA